MAISGESDQGDLHPGGEGEEAVGEGGEDFGGGGHRIFPCQAILSG